MAFQVSPGVNVSEIDLTTVVPAVATTQGAIGGVFRWGPIGKIVLVDSETTLVNRFGKPTNLNAETFFTAANFLAYGNQLYVSRAADTSDVGSGFATTAVATSTTNPENATYNVTNSDDYDAKYESGAFTAITSDVKWIAKYPGALGESLLISQCDAAADFAGWDYKGSFDSAPGTSTYQENFGNPAVVDEVHIIVVDEDGKFTGIPGTVLEVFQGLSRATDAKTVDGATNYYVNVINQTSKYVWFTAERADNYGLPAAELANTAGTGALTLSFIDGFDGDDEANINTSKVTDAYDLFSSTENVNVSLVMTGRSDSSATIPNYIIDNIAEVRKDCVAFVSPRRADVVNNVGFETQLTASEGHPYSIPIFRNLLSSSSYAVLDSGYKYQYDKYNDVYRYVPLNGDIAGLCVITDNVRDPWFSPAGFNRGQIKNIVKLAYNPNKTDRDVLYPLSVNPVATFPGQGTVLFGDKTFQAKPSAFDRINVRRLFIVLEKSISTAAKYSLFEFNDAITRSNFVSLVEPFLRDVQGRRGIYDFRVVCDETNNTPEVIDSNRFVGDIYIKPARSINFIQLNFVAVRTGVEFSEIVGKF